MSLCIYVGWSCDELRQGRKRYFLGEEKVFFERKAQNTEGDETTQIQGSMLARPVETIRFARRNRGT